MVDVSLGTINALCEDYARAIKHKAELKDKLSEVEHEIGGYSMKLLAYLKDNKLTNFPSEFGRAEIYRRTSVRTPQAENREAFFEYLKTRGHFEELITVNSQTLNRYYKDEMSAHAFAQETLDPNLRKPFSIPGIEAPTITEKVIMKGVA